MTLACRAPISLSRTGARSARHLSLKSSVTIGLRQEDPERVWERRTPLPPAMVAKLIEKEGVRVLVQECERRVFPIDDYIHAGAEIHPTLEPAHVVMGIKETPLKTLVTSPLPSPVVPGRHVPRTHIMFSHTIKGQEYNMQLLSRFLKGGDAFHSGVKCPPGLEARLIDYELLTDENGKRTVMFGFFAGVAGALESLLAMAHKHLQNGVASPFLYIPRPQTVPSLDDIRSQLRGIGSSIAKYGTPKSLGPCIIGVTGQDNGNVTDGVMSILAELPIQRVKVEDLPALASNPDADLSKVYVAHCLPPSYITRTDGSPYERSDYYANPGSYQSHFHSRVAPYLTLFINGAGWAPGFPRLLTTAQLPLATRLAAIGDISCDIGGGIEFVTRATTLSEPTFDVGGVAVMSVDILPASLPRDASMAFSNMAERYVRALVKEYKGERVEDEEALRAIERASVAKDGKLKEGLGWLGDKVNAWRVHARGASVAPMPAVGSRKQRVLILGSGMVAGPTVDELAGRGDIEVVVASNVLGEAQRLVAEHDSAKATQVDMNNHAAVQSLIGQADVVISLLPVPFHPSVAELCIQHKKHLVTASYISPTMKALHDRAVGADVLLLNEIGLDPGIDHCSAHAMLEHLRVTGRTRDILSFVSFCGGLPAPESANVPLGYKFSWNPRGVLRAASESARFLLDGKMRTVPGEMLLKSYFPDVPVAGSENAVRFEGLANRDSMPYVETYRLPKPEEGLQTMLRGTLRYSGFARLMQSFKDLGFLEPTKPVTIDSWPAFTRHALQSLTNSPVPSDEASVLAAVRQHVAPDAFDATWTALRHLGLVPGSESAVIDSPQPPRAPLPPADLLALHLAHALRYLPGERDLVVLAHELVVRAAGGSGADIYTARLVVYGDERASAMARTVGLPVALAARQVLAGRVGARGVCGPTASGADAVWKGVLEGLEERKIGMLEEVRTVRFGMTDVLVKGLEGAA
ncbi:Saccharopine dehydrogenase-domain-containing protein [Vararia minispora EC-137]|uniref:Saccharopine dehydrogenase-domain-containing protein n=1 Tax=Vararia minispora EC-137 TaxID=1314806 RepID=A0ACB8QJI6_9AGAM|nr:Saccharopine dehydrogenase-domain-containing protein [Vararia minispora EC-137]